MLVDVHESAGADRHVGQLEGFDDLASLKVPDVALACAERDKLERCRVIQTSLDGLQLKERTRIECS